MLTLLVTLSLAGVEVAPGTPCLSAAGLQQRLSAAGVVVKPGTVVRLEPSPPDGVLVRYVTKGAVLERRVPAPAHDCDAVARVVVALVQAWAAPRLTEPMRGAVDGGRALDGGAGGSGDGHGGEASSSGAAPSVDGGAGRLAVDAGTGVREAAVSVNGDAGRVAADAGAMVGQVRPSDAVVSVNSDAGRTGGDAGATVGKVRPSDAVVLVDGRAGRVVLDAGATAGQAETAVDGGEAPTRLDVSRSRDAGEAEARSAFTSDGGQGIAVLVRTARDGGLARFDETPSRSDPGDGSQVRPVLALEGARLELGAGDAGATVAAAADAVAESTAPRGEPPRWTLGAGLLGGIASGATSEVLAAGLVAVDVTRGWFGASVDVGLSTAATNTVGRGAASSAWQWLSASARLAVPVRERLLLEAQLGVRGYRVTARATGFDEVDPERVQFSVGAVGSVGASFRVVGPFAVTLRLTGNTRRAESFFVSNLGPVLETGPLEGSALAGVVARF